MNNNIRDTEKLFNRQLESARRKNEREIKNIENAHVNLKGEIKKVHADEVVEIQDQHHRHLNAEAEKKEKVLSGMRDHLQKTSELTEKQLKSLKQNSETQKVETQRKLSDERERLIGENQLFIEDLNERFNQSSQKVNYDGKRRVEDLKNEMGEALNETEAFHQNKINNQTEQFTTRFKHDDMNYKKMKDEQDNRFKKERMSTNTLQQIELSKLTDTHTKHIDQRDGEYRKGLKDQDVFFEKKYQDTLKDHNSQFKILEEKNKKVISELKTSLTKEITQAANRRDDEFYQFSSLRPKVKQFEDRVEIQMDVPEHAKQDLQLTTNIKEVILSLNRRYTDANKTSDGVINKVNKVESFTTRIPTNMVLDAKSVKSTYEGGTMTYVIKKA